MNVFNWQHTYKNFLTLNCIRRVKNLHERRNLRFGQESKVIKKSLVFRALHSMSQLKTKKRKATMKNVSRGQFTFFVMLRKHCYSYRSVFYKTIINCRISNGSLRFHKRTMDCRCHTGEECIEVDHVPLTACGFSVGGKRLWMGEACRFTGDECVEVDHDSLPAG